MYVFAQENQSPMQKNDYLKPSSYDELSAYIQQLDRDSELLKAEVIGKSVQGRNIYALKFSASEFGKDRSKVKVLILAQQHGNEQSGKEGALLLAEELIKPENHYLFKKIDLVIVPQMNPDGAEANKRRNGNGADLNRNHLILTEPETMALHDLFDKYLFEVTLDVHEYSPYGESWKNYGYRNNSAELLGITTNTNVSQNIRELSKNSFLPFMKKFFDERSVSNFVYSPGGPPEIEYIRHSTFDINDGRQSFGIQNSLSFIQEGLNGTDSYVENLRNRAEGQKTGMRGLLEFAYQNKNEIKKTVSNERKKLISTWQDSVSIQAEHVRNGEKLHLPVYSYFTGNDSVIIVNDYRPVVKSIYNVEKPSGYLIPKKLNNLVNWIERQNLETAPCSKSKGDKIEQYEIISIDSIDFEGDIVANPHVIAKEVEFDGSSVNYIYVPTAQLKGNLIVIALEPKSMLGLATYKDFSDLLVAGGKFPILRVFRK
jgi:hypothetical protein